MASDNTPDALTEKRPGRKSSYERGGEKMSGGRFSEQLATQRRARALDALTRALDEELEVPAPVERIERRHTGGTHRLTAPAYELARQVYYLQAGSIRDAARAIIAAGLSDTDDLTQVSERLQTWWWREQWPKRSFEAGFALRDAANDGGLYRGRVCKGLCTGSGPAPEGKPCEQSALDDSDYCYHHDPRPKYVEIRRRQVEGLVGGRRRDLVPLAPFQRFCERKRKQMLAELVAVEQVHPNNEGWGLLADAMGVSLSVLGKLMKGKHSRGNRVTTIRAKTVARYLEPLGLAFEDLYDFPQPRPYGPVPCPGCGGRKGHQSRLCRTCWTAENKHPCKYVNRRGKRCNLPTAHESGHCHKCRRIVEHVPRPRTGAPTLLTAPMLILALEEYEDLPRMQWVAARMWSLNAAGVRDAFKSQKSLTGSLVKQFRKRGWYERDPAELRAELVARHGEVGWPGDSDTRPLRDVIEVPIEPFRRWLAARYYDSGCRYNVLAERLGLHPDRLSKIVRGLIDPPLVRRSTIERALEHWGGDTTFDTLYRKEARHEPDAA